MSGVHDLTVTVLREIRDGIGEVREQVAETNRRLDRNQAETNTRLDAMNDRLDNVIDIAGGGWRSHERRLARLELRVERLEGHDTEERRER